MNITSLTNVDFIITDLSTTNKEEAIKTMVNKLSSEVVKDKDQLYADVLAREQETTTGIGNGIAIPHAKSQSVSKTSIVIAKSKNGIDYQALDEKPVHLLFLLAVEHNNNNQHIKLLSSLSKLLLNNNFKQSLLQANTPQEIIDIIDSFQNNQTSASSTKQTTVKAINIVAVTACPTGIAHTYMAQEALEKAAKNLNVNIKVETNGTTGVDNQLTQAEIEQADGVILAINRNVEVARFNGKKLIQTSAQDAIKNAEPLIHNIIDGKAPVFYSSEQASATNSASSNLKGAYKHLLTGVSYMLPFVVSGGILIALAFVIDKLYGVPPGPNLGSTHYLAQLFMTIGKEAFSLFVPVLGAFIAYSIANRAALTAGLVGGALALSGGSGFLGAILAGFLAGYFTNFYTKIFKSIPKSLDGIKNILFLPLSTVFSVGIVMLVLLNGPVRVLNSFLVEWLHSMHGSHAIYLGLILGGMMAIDMGGPFNKAAYVFGVASLAQGASTAMASVMVGGMVPPLAIALATTFFKSKFTLEEREAGKTNYVMGLSFITEGAIPFVASDPLRMIPICVIGSAIAGGISMLLNITLPAPHGGLVVMFLTNHITYYFLALLVGSVVSAVLMGIFKKSVTTNKLTTN